MSLAYAVDLIQELEASNVVPLRAVECAAHLCPFSNDVGNRRLFLNRTIDLNAFNLLEE